ncbi:N-acetyltransferase [Aliiroseovarius zhejiangensis]|uniref:N-acetyltransferase n=1 Tax=Aliiroseovarius zhejiangensis TaxID=1632025 RepID=A0ABQ3IWB6_9RHOB|nr:GNAT family protein [Aliiroseovarius zhejiangensis]GHE95387.1 N-acetyltransferase [Aliiroseovarius zhejiangensis]
MIRTDRLCLRAPRQDDLDDLHAVFAHPDAMRYWSHPAHTQHSRTQQVLDGMIRSHRATGLEYVVAHEGRVIGKAGLWRIAELGYILHPDHWGKGLGREALLAVLGAAWDRHPGIDRITAEIDPRNIASARLLDGLGFQVTGHAENTLQVNGEWCDSIYYALPRPEAAA